MVRRTPNASVCTFLKGLHPQSLRHLSLHLRRVRMQPWKRAHCPSGRASFQLQCGLGIGLQQNALTSPRDSLGPLSSKLPLLCQSFCSGCRTSCAEGLKSLRRRRSCSLSVLISLESLIFCLDALPLCSSSCSLSVLSSSSQPDGLPRAAARSSTGRDQKCPLGECTWCSQLVIHWSGQSCWAPVRLAQTAGAPFAMKSDLVKCLEFSC